MQEAQEPDDQTSSANLADLSVALRDLADQRQQELELRFIEADLEKQRIINTHEYSLEQLKLSLVDRDSQRQTQKRNTTVGAAAAVVLFAMLLGFFSLAIWKGKDQIVIEIIKAVLVFAGGYGVGKGRKAKDEGDAAPKTQ